MSILLMHAPWSYAEKPPAPMEIPGAVKVDAEGVIKIADEIPGLKIIDSRVTADRKQGYIESSISLPDESTTCESLARFIPKKNSPVLFYCNGVKCGRSVVAIGIAQKCGYTNIYWFRGGFEEWLAKRYPVVRD
jgi:rhodanese-related sulfurtransferase